MCSTLGKIQHLEKNGERIRKTKIILAKKIAAIA